MTVFSAAGTCVGCGKSIQPSRGGAPRKWCSERCRKSQYDRACIDCGVRIDGTTPGRSGGRCLTCANRRPRPKYVQKRSTVEAMWADGRTEREICEVLGLKYDANHKGHPSYWRARGYDLPHRRTPEQLERILAGSTERMAAARAARGSAA